MAHHTLERKKSFKRSNKKATDYFAAASKDDNDFPTTFINCVNHLEENALDEEGILRIHGRTQDTNAINAFLSSGNTNRATTLGQVDPHAVATLLKSYLNQGPPLLPMEQYSAFVEIGSKKEPGGDVILFLRDVVCGIPPTHQRVFHRVLIFIDNVRQHSAKNKMDARALAIIFNPILLRAPTEVSPAQILSQTQSCINCVLLLMNNYQAIFEGIGLNSFDTPTGSPVPGKEGSLRDFSSTSLHVTKDKVKIRFLFYFTIKTGGCIRDTVSLFLKYSKQGVKRESGQTKALVCTNPQEVVWEDVVPLEVTLVVNKRTKTFESRNFVVTLKCVTQKGSKTLGAASINLAELSAPTLQASPKEEFKTYDMLHKGGKSKSLMLQVRSHSDWRKLNNKLVVRQEESGTNSRRSDDPPSRMATLRGKAALMSMPNLNNFDLTNRADKTQEDERYPLSARDQYKSESSISTPTKTPENPFATTATPPGQITSTAHLDVTTTPTAYSYAPITTPTLLEGVPAPDFSAVAAASLHSTPTPNPPSSNPNPNPNPNLNSNPNPNQDLDSDPKQSSMSAAETQKAIINELHNPKSSSADLESANITSPSSDHSTSDPVAITGTPDNIYTNNITPAVDTATTNLTTPATTTSYFETVPNTLSDEEHKNNDNKEDATTNNHHQSTQEVSTSKMYPPQETSALRKLRKHSPKEQRRKEREKSPEKHSDRPKTRERSHSHVSSDKHATDWHEKPTRKQEEKEETAPVEEKKKDSSSSDASADQQNGVVIKSSLRVASPETTPVIKKRLTISELHIPQEGQTSHVSPRSPRIPPPDDGESDLESDNDFEGVNSPYAQKLFELSEQIELLQQQRRQLELETFNLRKCLVHNEIYRPQTLDFSERGIASTAEQIIENLLQMNCFLEPHNFPHSFFESIIISLQQESKNEVEVPKILYWISTTLGLLYLLSMSIKSIPDPSVLGVLAMTMPIQVEDGASMEGSEKSNDNLLYFARGIQRTGLELYNKVLKLFGQELDDEKLVLAFLGRPKEKEEKRNFVIKEKPYEPGMKTPEPVLTPAVALKEILREVNDNYQLLKDAKIFEIFAWHMALHRLFYLDHLLVHELSVQKKIYSTDAQIIKQAAGEIERRVHEKFPTYSNPCPLKMTSQFVALVTAEYSKLDSETYINSSFTLLKPSQILQILEVLRPDKDSRKPVPASVQKVLQAMAKSETDKPRVMPMTWHLSDEITKMMNVVH